MELTTVLIVCGVLLVLFLILIFNRLISLRNNRKQAYSDIDVQLKLRYDLIPNILETVKGYAKHEKSTFENVTKARSQAMQAGNIKDKAEAENMLTSTLKSLFAVAENYPELKANQNFLHLQMELSDVEDKIAAARRFFNHATKEFNTSIQQFPNNMVAGLFGFKSEEFFALGSAEEAENVKVKL